MKTLKNIIAGSVIGLSALGLTSTARAEDPVGTINCDFKKVVEMQNPGSSYKTLQNYLDGSAGIWDNLKIRTDYNDASGNSDEVVSKTGYRNTTTGMWVGEKWDAGFLKIFLQEESSLGLMQITIIILAIKIPRFLEAFFQVVCI
jgi:hypothetical protein